LPESLTRRARPWDFRTPAVGGRHHLGMVAGFSSEWWPASVRNGGRFQIGIPAGFTSEYLAGMRRNLHQGSTVA
jgi:hypothetical protein